MKVIGIERNDFVVRGSDTKITGVNIYFARNILPERGKGQAVERYYFTDAKLEKNGIDITNLLGKSVTVGYNRFGKADTVTVDA